MCENSSRSFLPAAWKEQPEDEEFQELVDLFVDGLPEKLESIAKAVRDRAWLEVADIAHNIKGMGGSFGHPELTEMASSLEQAAKAASYPDAARHLEILQQRVAEIFEERPASDDSPV